MVFLIISGEILILPNFKWVVGEKEEGSLPAQNHYQPVKGFLKKFNTKFYWIRFQRQKLRIVEQRRNNETIE